MRFYRLPDYLRPGLQHPIGRLYRNKPFLTPALAQRLHAARMLITVGDATTQRLLEQAVVPAVQIVDAREKRQARPPIKSRARTVVRVVNPAGGLTDEALEAVQKARRLPKPVRLEVEGEEDLMVLPVVASYPLGSICCYGQPNEGIVAITVTLAARRRAGGVLRRMGITAFGRRKA